MQTKLTLLTVLAAAMFVGGCASTEPAFVSDGLVAYYPFNGNAKDESGKGNHGEVKGPLHTADRHGNAGGAYSFDGTDANIQIHETENFEANSITLSLWIQTEKFQVAEVIGKDGESPHGNQRQWIIETRPNGQIIAVLWTTKNANSKNGYIAYSNRRINLGEWNHISLCWNGSYLQLYLNGVGDASVATGEAETIALGNQPVRIGGGAPDGAAQFHFKGSIDDVRIYNRALSAEEVKALYDLEKPKDETAEGPSPKYFNKSFRGFK